MDEKIKQQLKLSTSSSSISMDDGEEEFLYETIEAPKFVDFTRPNHFCPDDRYWFCSRVGCDRKHEKEMDSEAIYKKFVLRVMAARSPNVRLRKALIRKPTSETKCPLSAPPKPSKSRIPRLALVSSISKKLINDAKGTTKPPTAKPSSTPKARVKHVAAKYMTSPRKNKPTSPNPNAFRSVRNTKRTSITIPKNKVVAKALVFNSPRKALKGKKAVEEMATPITKLCKGIKKLEIASHKKGNAPKPSKECKSARKLLPSDALREKPSACKAKTQIDAKFTPSVGSKMKKKAEKRGETVLREARVRYDSSNMETDGKSRAGLLDLKNTSSSTDQQEATSGGNSDAVSENSLTSEMVSSDSVSVPENPEVFGVPQKDKENGEKKGSAPEGELDNRNAKILGDLAENDDKENALNSDDTRNLNGGNRIKHDAPVKHKTPKTADKSLKENCPADNGTQGVKYRKLKPTNPKPFRLRTDERGILKDATLERKANSHESTTTASENSQCTSNEISEKREKEAKKDSKKSLKMNKRAPIKSKYDEVETKSDRGVFSDKSYNRTKSSSSQKQLARPQREKVSSIKIAGLQAIEATGTMLKPKELGKRTDVAVNPTKKGSTSLKLAARVKRPATVPREPNFQSLNKPKDCTKNVECSVF